MAICQKRSHNETLIYALLDTMLDTTFVTNDAMSKLKVIRQKPTLVLTTTTSQAAQLDCQVYDSLIIRGVIIKMKKFKSHEHIHGTTSP